jgi:hypothetical protein
MHKNTPHCPGASIGYFLDQQTGRTNRNGDQTAGIGSGSQGVFTLYINI